MLKSLPLIRRGFTEAQFCIAPADRYQAPMIRKIMGAQNLAPGACKIVDGGARALFSQCHLVIAASGTVTLEAAIAGVPMVVIYKVSPFSYLLGRLMISVDHISLVNLIARKAIVPELIQNQVTPENIAAEVVAMMKGQGHLNAIRRDLARVRARLGTSGAARRVAELAFRLIR